MFNQSNFLGALQTGGQRPIDLFVRIVPPLVRPAHPRLGKCALLRGHFGWLNPLTKVFYYIGVNCYIIAKICANFVDASGRHFILFGRTVKTGAHRIESQPPTPLIILTQ